MKHMMSLPARIWTAAVAYIALAIGAGLSIAGNVADTFRTRGAAVDTLDIVMAVSWPALVVLMVEMFVSSRWTGQGLAMQILRWTGCLSIGAMAMRVSWVHLNDLMLSRGQANDVATLGPLAIDALAIMATALILSGRGQVKAPVVLDKTLDTQRAELEARLAKEAAEAAHRLATRPEPTAADLAELNSVTAGVDRALTAAGQELHAEVDSYLSRLAGTEPSTLPVPVIRPEAPRQVSQRRLGGQDKREIRELMTAVRSSQAYSLGEARLMLSVWYGTSVKSIQRAEVGMD